MQECLGGRERVVSARAHAVQESERERGGSRLGEREICTLNIRLPYAYWRGAGRGWEREGTSPERQHPERPVQCACGPADVRKSGERERASTPHWMRRAALGAQTRGNGRSQQQHEARFFFAPGRPPRAPGMQRDTHTQIAIRKTSVYTKPEAPDLGQSRSASTVHRAFPSAQTTPGAVQNV